MFSYWMRVIAKVNQTPIWSFDLLSIQALTLAIVLMFVLAVFHFFCGLTMSYGPE
jgi:hypothetical protein